MKIHKSVKANEAGIAHIGLIVLVLAVVSIAGFATYRVISSRDNTESALAADDDFDVLGSDTEDTIQESDDEASSDDITADGQSEEGENAI